MRVVFTGGGTAGHIYPIIAIVREMRAIHPQEDLQIFYVGPKDEFGSLLLAQEGVKVKKVLAGKVRRYWSVKSFFSNLLDIFFKIPLGFLQSFFYLFFLAPDVVFSKGGYGSAPTVFASWLLRVPIFLHESDVSPGLANRMAEKFALDVFVSFPVPKTEYFSREKMIRVGNPVRAGLLEGSRERARELFELSNRPVVFVMGGSQGAEWINDLMLLILPELLSEFELIHQCGEKNFDRVVAEAGVVAKESLKKYYHLIPFLKETELKHAYAAADVVVSRAGAGSIFEIATLGKPSILIPLPSAAQDHQIKNAYAYAASGAAMVFEQEGLTPHFLLERIRYIMERPQQRARMAAKARSFSQPYAARVIASYLLEYLS